MKTTSTWLIGLVIFAAAAGGARAATGSIDEDIRGLPGKTVELVGTLEVSIIDYLDDRPPGFAYVLQTNDAAVVLENFDGSGFRTGNTMRLSGELDGQNLTVSSGEVFLSSAMSAVSSRSAASVQTSARTVGVFFVNFSDVSLSSAKMNEVEGAMYTDVYYPYWFLNDYSVVQDITVKASFENDSFGQITIDSDADMNGEFDIFGPFDITAASTSCQAYSWRSSVNALASQQGIDLTLYQHKVYVLPDNACTWRGLGALNCGNDCSAWIRMANGVDPLHTITHEIAHNLGLLHNGSDLDGDGVIQQDESDVATVMGGGTPGFGDLFTAQHRDDLGWFDAIPGSILDISATGTGTYTLADLGDLGVDPMTLRLQVMDGPVLRNFHITYRQSDIIEPYGVSANFFDTNWMIDNTIRVHEKVLSGHQDSWLVGQISENETFLYDSFTSTSDEIGFWISPGSMGGETTEIHLYVGDSDSDGVLDYQDNCYLTGNADQFDADCDGYGNICDADFNNDSLVDFSDLAIFKQAFFGTDALTDLDNDGLVSFSDLALFNSLFFKSPGPAGPAPSCGNS